MSRKNRPHGHYCKVCGQYKANEKFSGKGHAAHICKACSHLSAAEKAEAMTINRLMNLSMNRLNDSEKKWLENRVHDKRPEVAEMAREIYRMHFPYAERNAVKKQLMINKLIFEIHTEVWDGYGDYEMVDRCFDIGRKERTVTMQDYGGQEPGQSVILDGGRMAKLLKWIVHALEIFMWPQDCCLSYSGSDFFKNIIQEFDESDESDMDEGLDFDGFALDGSLEGCKEPLDKGTGQEVSWRVQIEYTNDAWQEITCCDGQLIEQAEELYFRLLEYFEPEEY